jgi:hypothetical protein
MNKLFGVGLIGVAGFFLFSGGQEKIEEFSGSGKAGGYIPNFTDVSKKANSYIPTVPTPTFSNLFGETSESSFEDPKPQATKKSTSISRSSSTPKFSFLKSYYENTPASFPEETKKETKKAVTPQFDFTKPLYDSKLASFPTSKKKEKEKKE